MALPPSSATGHPGDGALYPALFDTHGDAVRSHPWEGAGGEGGDLGWSVQEAAKAPTEAQPPPVPAADDGLRCLDPGHEKQCARRVGAACWRQWGRHLAGQP